MNIFDLFEGESARDKWNKESAKRDAAAKKREEEMTARHNRGKEDMSGAIDRLEKHLNKPIEEHGGGVNAMNKYIAWRKSANKEHGVTKGNPPVGKPAEECIGEAANPAQQAAIAISMKKAGKKPKSVDEDFNLERIGHAECPVCHNNDLDWDEDTQTVVCKGCRSEFEASGKQIKQDIAEDYGSWIVYDPKTKQIKKRFKTHTAGKSYAKIHSLGFASSEYYFDNVKEKAVAEEKTRLDPKCWTGKKIGNPKTKVKGGVRVNNCVPAEEGMFSPLEESYTGVMESQGITDPKLLEVARRIDAFAKNIK